MKMITCVHLFGMVFMILNACQSFYNSNYDGTLGWAIAALQTFMLIGNEIFTSKE